MLEMKSGIYYILGGEQVPKLKLNSLGALGAYRIHGGGRQCHEQFRGAS